MRLQKSSQSHCVGLFLGIVCSFFFHRHVFHPQILLQISRPGGANRIFGPTQDLQCKRAMQQSKLKKNIGTLIHLATFFLLFCSLLVAVGSSGILKAKQKLGVTFNFDKQDVIDLTKFSKMTMCRASEANSEKQSQILCFLGKEL